jgi:hypothetical protein
MLTAEVLEHYYHLTFGGGTDEILTLLRARKIKPFYIRTPKVLRPYVKWEFMTVMDAFRYLFGASIYLSFTFHPLAVVRNEEGERKYVLETLNPIELPNLLAARRHLDVAMTRDAPTMRGGLEENIDWAMRKGDLFRRTHPTDQKEKKHYYYEMQSIVWTYCLEAQQGSQQNKIENMLNAREVQVWKLLRLFDLPADLGFVTYRISDPRVQEVVTPKPILFEPINFDGHEEQKTIMEYDLTTFNGN